MIAAAFLNPVRWGTWSLWLAAGIMMTLDAAVVLLIYRRIRHAHLTPPEPVVKLPPPPLALRERAAKAHGKDRRDAVSVAAAMAGVSLWLVFLTISFLLGLGLTTATYVTVIFGFLTLMAGLSCYLYVNNGPLGRILVNVGEGEWRDALSVVTTPVAAALEDLRGQVDELRDHLQKTVTFSDDLEATLADFATSTNAQIAGYAEMEAKNTALHAALSQGDRALALTLAVVDEQREKDKLVEKKRARSWDVVLTVVSLVAGFLLGQMGNIQGLQIFGP